MEREDIGDAEAFDIMRRSSRRSGKPLRDEAVDMLDSTHKRGPDVEPPEGERRG
jgi:hypothetical protein